MFFAYRDLQRRPTGAGRRSQAAFRANLYARKRRGRKKEEKSGRTQFFWGLNIWLIAPNPGANRLLRPFSPPPSLQVATMGTHGPVAAHPPPAQRAAESRARLCCILGRSGACAVAVRTREQRPAEAVQNQFGCRGMAHAQKTGLLPPQHHAPKKRIEREANGREICILRTPR